MRVQPIASFLHGLANICYFFAFATPRPLQTKWQRAEHAKYIEQALEREPDERGRLAADDLFQAAVRVIGGAVTIVAVRPSPAIHDLVVQASSASRLRGTSLQEHGLIARALSSGAGVTGRLADCEPDLVRALGPQAVSVLVAPIVADGPTWGVVIVGQRRGALFPEDDLAMLARLGRTSATALDHAHLVGERRARERAEADRKLIALESRVQEMLDSITDYAIFVLNGRGEIAAWHSGAAQVFGAAAGDMLGRHAAPLYGLTAAELDLWLGEAREHGRFEREARCTRPDGSGFTGTTIIRPLVEDAGAAPGFVVVTRDVTEQRRFEEHFRHLQKMEAIGQLAGGVAHDFNNLLTAIVGYAEWLKQDLNDDPRQPHADRILSSATRGADLTRQLLAFSRRQLPTVTPLNISHVVAGMLPVLQRVLGERIDVIDRTDPYVSPVMGDRSQIEQVILNLVVNARDAMPDRGALTIRTQNLRQEASAGNPAMLAAGDYVVLEVTDTGIGMDDATRQRVFEPFFTTKDVGRGTGLGLAMVYGIVQQMAGSIQVESELGRGSTFRLWFPRASAANTAVETAAARPSAVTRGNETLLVVEDETAVRQYLRHVLEANGYRVLIAEDPAQAIALMDALEEPVDLLISDVVMPGTSGPDLARRLQRARPGVGVLFISGYTGNVLAPSVRDLTAAHFLSKPFSRHELLTKVREILAAA